MQSSHRRRSWARAPWAWASTALDDWKTEMRSARVCWQQSIRPGRAAVILVCVVSFASVNWILSRSLARPTDRFVQKPIGDVPGLNQTLLTIVVDGDRGDPVCTVFIHKLLPGWVRWRYVSVHGDRIADLAIDTPALIVTRWIDPGSVFLSWAAQHQHAVGLMLMADETNQQNPAVYAPFDYVLRHYYFRHLTDGPDIAVQALGNRTCAGSPAPPPSAVYWLMLLGRGLGNLDSGHGPRTYWPAGRRRRPAIWIGSLRADRAEMVDVMRAAFPDADLQVEDGFGGRVGPFQYGYERAANAVFALVPFGNNPETHRLAEMIDQGCIPVFLDAEFRRATFEPVPGIVAESWAEAARQMKAMLEGDPERLDELQGRVVRWWHRMKQCMMDDLGLILRDAQARRSARPA